jgi:hypothetical protein
MNFLPKEGCSIHKAALKIKITAELLTSSEKLCLLVGPANPIAKIQNTAV